MYTINNLDDINYQLLVANEELIDNKNRYVYLDSEGQINLVLSFSLLNKMFAYGNETEFCPRYLYEVVMTRNIVPEPTLPMKKGLFFETLCIGSTAHGALYDLPRKKVTIKMKKEAILKGLDPEKILGDKTIDQIRIEEQAALFPSKSRNYGISIFKDGAAQNVQVEVQKQWTSTGHTPDFKVWIQATIDIVSNIIFNGKQYNNANIDLKLTADRDGQGELEKRNSFSKFNYGDPDNLDYLQLNLDTYITGNPSFYWVWDYRKDYPGEKIIPHFTSNIEFAELNEIIRKGALNLAQMDKDNYPYKPSYWACKKCPMANFNGGQCQFAKKWVDNGENYHSFE
jgi:hypothetical protein